MKKLNLMMRNKDNLLMIFLNKAQLRRLFRILWGIAEFLTNVMPIVIGDFYTMIDLYSVRPIPLSRASTS